MGKMFGTTEFGIMVPFLDTFPTHASVMVFLKLEAEYRFSKPVNIDRVSSTQMGSDSPQSEGKMVFLRPGSREP